MNELLKKNFSQWTIAELEKFLASLSEDQKNITLGQVLGQVVGMAGKAVSDEVKRKLDICLTCGTGPDGWREDCPTCGDR